MQTTYRPGQWYLIVRPGVLVALPPDASVEIVTSVWEQTSGSASLASLIDVLTSQAGGVLGALPSFAAVVADGAGLRVALRGEVSARARTATGPQELTGADVTTWSERLVGNASDVEISLEPGTGDAALPLESGVARAASVSAGFSSGTAVAEPEPAPVAEPEPEPEPAPLAGAEPADAPVAEPAEEPAAAEPDEPAGPAEATMSPSEVTLAPTSEDFDQLWGETVISVPAAEPTPADAPVADGLHGDHDGSTISVAELRARREQSSPTPDAPTALLPVTPAESGRIRLSTGQVVALDRTVIIGRRPRSTRASGTSMPHLVAVDSPQQDISRSHLEIRPEADTVVVIDLHTTNGSTLLRPGADPVRLHPGEQTLVLSGDVVDLGDGVKVEFEDLP
jgi:hypothetical protein